MILSYNEAIKEYGSEYKLAKAVNEGAIYKKEEGIYSSSLYVSELAIIMKISESRSCRGICILHS